jgi:hypothetical protein
MSSEISTLAGSFSLSRAGVEDRRISPGVRLNTDGVLCGVVVKAP